MLPRSSTKLQVGPDPRQLGTATDRTGGHGRAVSKIGQAMPDERVCRVTALTEGVDHQTVGDRGRQVLRRVHGDVGPTVEHRHLHLLDEHSLPTDDMEWNVESGVAGRLDHHAARPSGRLPR